MNMIPFSSCRGRRQRGGVRLRIVLATVTLLLVGITIVFFLRIQRQRHEQDLRKALIIGEYGLQQALEHLHGSPSWRADGTPTVYSKGTYSITAHQDLRNDSLFLTVNATGRSGSAVRTKTARLILTISESGDSVWLPLDLQ